MSKQRQNSGEEICRQIYRAAKKFYAEEFKDREDDPGFQILYGPPFFHTPVLFLGYQPGKGRRSALEEREYGSEDRWPSKSEYLTECWTLAKRLREMFGEEFIERCVGLNAIFVRAHSMKNYRELDLALRSQIEEFCLPRVEEIVNAIQPKLIVAIGFATLDLLGVDDVGIPKTNQKGRVLTKRGKIYGRDALGVLHLSGAWISKQDRETIARHIVSSSI